MSECIIAQLDERWKCAQIGSTAANILINELKLDRHVRFAQSLLLMQAGNILEPFCKILFKQVKPVKISSLAPTRNRQTRKVATYTNFGVCDFSRLAVTDWRLWRWRVWLLALSNAPRHYTNKITSFRFQVDREMKLSNGLPSSWDSIYSLSVILEDSVDAEHQDLSSRCSLNQRPILFNEKRSPAVTDTLETLELGYSVDWPLTLVLSPQNIERYNEIFRLLLKIKFGVWALLQMRFSGRSFDRIARFDETRDMKVINLSNTSCI